jgi:disulfide bond formation protein DsbB
MGLVLQAAKGNKGAYTRTIFLLTMVFQLLSMYIAFTSHWILQDSDLGMISCYASTFNTASLTAQKFNPDIVVGQIDIGRVNVFGVFISRIFCDSFRCL